MPSFQYFYLRQSADIERLGVKRREHSRHGMHLLGSENACKIQTGVNALAMSQERRGKRRLYCYEIMSKILIIR